MNATAAEPLAAAAQAAARAAVAWEEAAFLAADSVGVWVDDITDPHLGIAVQGKQIVYLGLSDGTLGMPIEQVQDLVNAAVVIAFGSEKSHTTTPRPDPEDGAS